MIYLHFASEETRNTISEVRSQHNLFHTILLMHLHQKAGTGQPYNLLLFLFSNDKKMKRRKKPPVDLMTWLLKEFKEPQRAREGKPGAGMDKYSNT